MTAKECRNAGRSRPADAPPIHAFLLSLAAQFPHLPSRSAMIGGGGLSPDGRILEMLSEHTLEAGHRGLFLPMRYRRRR
jgi:hypothetical protein